MHIYIYICMYTRKRIIFLLLINNPDVLFSRRVPVCRGVRAEHPHFAHAPRDQPT